MICGVNLGTAWGLLCLLLVGVWCIRFDFILWLRSFNWFDCGGALHVRLVTFDNDEFGLLWMFYMFVLLNLMDLWVLVLLFVSFGLVILFNFGLCF